MLFNEVDSLVCVEHRPGGCLQGHVVCLPSQNAEV